MEGQDTAPITLIEQRQVYRNEFAAVYDDAVAFRDESRGHYLRIVESDGKPGVAMLAITAGQVALVHTYRYPVQAWQWGIPRGFAHDSDPSANARAELVEELGAAPAELTGLGLMTANSGLLAGAVHLFLARYHEPVSAPVDTAEVAAVRWISAAALRRDIAAGQITDGFTLAAVGCAICRGLL